MKNRQGFPQQYLQEVFLCPNKIIPSFIVIICHNFSTASIKPITKT